MTTLSVDKPRTYELGDGSHYPVAASTKIYEGAAVGIVAGTGYARPLQAGDKFVGFAKAKADNSSGVAAAINVAVQRKGLIELPVTSLAITDVGNPVYASDDDTFVLTQSTNTHIGRVERFVSSGVGIIAFDADNGSCGAVSELAAATGTPSGTIADVGATFSQTTLNNNFKSIADKLNAVLRQLS